ncbi:MAG: PTS sugar transporter subunit IIB [Erysipelotrichaceae bacterium]|nr:PTS sugar transporter subunit IIB [Erysipelotrichaceae bacterium]
MRTIYLFCAAGMSTSLLVTKMQAYADEIGYECKVAAFPVSEAPVHGPNADIVLLGPQVRFNLKKVQEQLPGKPCQAIEMRDYGMMNGKAVIEMVKKTLGD